MQPLLKWMGLELSKVSHTEKLVSALGGFVAILLLVAVSQFALGATGSALLVASMGASAVLLFAVPHGQLSQPWPVIAGHVIPAFIGVVCARSIPNIPLAAGCAVGISIGIMHQLKCIHPPGGATALIAVIGGESVHALGYKFIVWPVLIDAMLIVAIAVAFNSFFKWRRYPASLNRAPRPPASAPPITHEQVLAALKQVDSFVDINEADLVRLSQLLLPALTKKA